MGLSTAQHPFSQVVEFVVEAQHQHDLINALVVRDERFISTRPGFISSSVQASEDGVRVLHHVLWHSRPHCEDIGLKVENPELDLHTLMRRCRATSATFGSFRIMGQVMARP
ncbi:antibiotic biosynthesis monooxygenase [Pseudomonas alliivorans]|uniref:antibiotic biosynthesis monooxygenase n=1 Tax=Pseudomonas alliivorans TaxID=2810613 RepID=UPI00211C3B11|nr:antibiotic biosynthesis monooxygenase [Pseudomonas alliivorans]MCQ9472094.1 antibiotic biosynthesis monooxygenase [Pseudomonas alliivorans]